MDNNNTSIGLCILSFLIPLVGWILYFVKKDTNTKAADAYGVFGIVGFVFNFVLILALS